MMVFCILASLALTNLPVQASPMVRIYVDMPLGYIPGVPPGPPPGGLVFVDLYIDTDIPDNTPQGIVQWAISVQVDPTVLEPMGVQGGPLPTYFLNDFLVRYGYNFMGYAVSLLPPVIDKGAGTMELISEGILGIPPIPNGAGMVPGEMPYKLCTLVFNSLSETEYSPIDLYYEVGVDAWYWTAESGMTGIPVDVVEDGHYTQPLFLTVGSTPIDGVNFTINTDTYTTNSSVGLPQSNHTVTVPSTWMVGSDKYNFVEWEDASTNPVRTVDLTSNMTITATYELAKEYTLTVNSVPIMGINFTVDGVTNTTNWSSLLLGGDYIVAMPSTWMVGSDKYNFGHWEDASTNPVRTVDLTSNMTVNATYVPIYSLTVESTPISNIDFTIGTISGKTNATVELKEGSYNVTILDFWPNPVYYFSHWEDASTNPVRTVDLTSNMTITATYRRPKKYMLTVNSEPITGINFTVGGTANTTNWSDILLEVEYLIDMSSTWTTVGGDVYEFKHWEDNSTSPIRTFLLSTNMTLTATYELLLKNYTLSVDSEPFAGINFTINGAAHATNWTDVLIEGNYAVAMPSTWTNGEGDVYNFTRWEDTSTNPSRTINLNSDVTITATYELAFANPTASFIFSPTEPVVDETVTFDATASEDPDGTVVSYLWEFGDGASDNGTIVEHAYTNAGTYDVTLTVTDNDGLSHTTTKSVTVTEAPPPEVPLELYLVAAGVIAIVIAAIALYYLRSRKTKPA